MFLTFSQIFSASKQIYHQIQQNPDSSKPKFSIPNKKKIHQIRDQPKIREQQNKNHPRHHNNNKKIRDQREQVDRRFGGKISGLTNGATISGFATISGEWVWRFLGSWRLVTNGFDDFWVRDLRNGFDSAISLSLFLCLRIWVLPSLALSLSLWALLDERARSWVFWVRQSSWMWIDLTFTGAGVLVQSLFLVVSFSLLFS